MMHSKATAALMRLKEIDRKYKFRQDESRRHLSDVSSDSAFENTSSMKNCPSNTKIKLEIQIPNISRVEPEVGTKMKGSLASVVQNLNDGMRKDYSRTSSPIIRSDILAPSSPNVADVKKENANNETSTSQTIRTIDERSGTISELSQNSETLVREESKARSTGSSVKSVYSKTDNLDSRLQSVHETYTNDTFENESSTTLISGKRSKSFENPSVSNSIEEEENDVRESNDDSIKQVEITPRNSPTRRSDDGRVDEVVVELVAPKLLQSTSECEVGLDKELSSYVKILEMREDKELAPVQLLKPPKHRGTIFSARRVKQRKIPAANTKSLKNEQETSNNNVTAVQSFDVLLGSGRFSTDDSDPCEQAEKARQNSIAKSANNKSVQEKETKKENDGDNNDEEEVEKSLTEKKGKASLNIVLNPSWDYESHYDDDVESVVTERDEDLLKEENNENEEKQTRKEEEEENSLVKVTGLKEVEKAKETEDEKKEKDEGQKKKQKSQKYVDVVGGGDEAVAESNCTECSFGRHENASMLLRKLHYDIITAIDNRYTIFERRVRAEKIAWKKSIAKNKERENHLLQKKNSRTSERKNYAHQRPMKHTRKPCIIHHPQISSPIRDHREHSEFVEENERMNVLKRRLNALRSQQERENLHDRIYQFEGTRLGLGSLAISGKLKPPHFAPLEFPKIANFTRNETVDARGKSFAGSHVMLNERIMSIRQWIKDQYFLYRDYSDLAQRINSKYVPVSLEEAKKTIRQLQETTIKAR